MLEGLRSSAPASSFFAEDGELTVSFCSLATRVLGQTALEAKKTLCCTSLRSQLRYLLKRD